jgi:hypothetical protein
MDLHSSFGRHVGGGVDGVFELRKEARKSLGGGLRLLKETNAVSAEIV